ncbi:hypothetical protein RFI_10223 [Reticulomyxa filosa]|uniref:Uncharacterized protein n=1 Tax=Reticulomyxa filosa TaxID=46433 RepID=X6NKX3_RETFI|nr:hypothetical protein RFI_10223 [Reticulomyxa filosa]|eukprot:ETO26920.1 hypothetical protein RFI_10223 [Reticulomyxa filosa]
MPDRLDSSRNGVIKKSKRTKHDSDESDNDSKGSDSSNDNDSDSNSDSDSDSDSDGRNKSKNLIEYRYFASNNKSQIQIQKPVLSKSSPTHKGLAMAEHQGRADVPPINEIHSALMNDRSRTRKHAASRSKQAKQHVLERKRRSIPGTETSPNSVFSPASATSSGSNISITNYSSGNNRKANSRKIIRNESVTYQTPSSKRSQKDVNIVVSATTTPIQAFEHDQLTNAGSKHTSNNDNTNHDSALWTIYVKWPKSFKFKQRTKQTNVLLSTNKILFIDPKDSTQRIWMQIRVVFTVKVESCFRRGKIINEDKTHEIFFTCVLKLNTKREQVNGLIRKVEQFGRSLMEASSK